MNIFGIGGWEFALILLIMLIVAGPRRMARWAYELGKQTARLRRMWEETASVLQREFDDAGLDIEVPKTPPRRGDLNNAVKNQVNKTMRPMTEPVEEALKEVEDVQKMTGGNGRTRERAPGAVPREQDSGGAARNGTATDHAAEAAPDEKASFGTWSGVQPPPPKTDGDDEEKA